MIRRKNVRALDFITLVVIILTARFAAGEESSIMDGAVARCSQLSTADSWGEEAMLSDGFRVWT